MFMRFSINRPKFLLRQFAFLIFLLCGTYLSNAQGCSDAGFCTMGAMKPDQPFYKDLKIRFRSLDFSNYVGITRFKDVILAQTIELNIAIKATNNIQVKLPYTSTSGPMGTVSGLSDVTISYTRVLQSSERFSWAGTIGGKIPTSDANVTVEGRSLPMYYQPSLGTYDLILGTSFKTRKWLVAAGYQHAFNENKNNFFWSPWKDTEKFDDARLYPVSIALKRGEDIMFRLERNFRFSKFNFSVGYLHIYRLNEDTKGLPDSDERVKVADDIGTSKGSAITGIFAGGYNFSVKSGVKVIVGRRIRKRHLNPDGLSREWVVSVGFQYKF